MLVQNPAQQAAQGEAKEQAAGQGSPVPVQISPQLPEVLQLLPQQTRPSTQVESSLHGQPNPAQPVARAVGDAARRRAAKADAPSPVSPRSTERRDRYRANERVQRSNRYESMPRPSFVCGARPLLAPRLESPRRGRFVELMHDDPASALLRFTPAMHHQRKLAFSSEERSGAAGAERLEPAVDRALPQYTPDCDWLVVALDDPSAEVAIIEQASGKPLRTGSNRHRTWFSKSLQA